MSQAEKRIRIRSKRLEEIDESKLALAVWLMAKQIVEDRTKKPDSREASSKASQYKRAERPRCGGRVMEGLVVAGALASCAACVGLLLASRNSAPMVAVELRFPRGVSQQAVEAVLGGISGLPRGSRASLELRVDATGISHRLYAERSALEMLRGHLRGVLPGVRLEPAEKADGAKWSAGLMLRWKGAHPVLRTDQASEASAALLGVCSMLGKSEAILVRWTLTPGRGPYLTRSDGKRQAQPWWMPGWQPSPEHLRAARTKYSGPILHARTVIAVKSGHPAREATLLGRVVSVIRARRTSWGNLATRRISARRIERALGRPQVGGARLSPGELAGLVGWPIDTPRVPGLSLGAAPQLMPSPSIPTKGRVFARSNWPGVNRPLAQPVVGGLSHTLVVGPTGVGKSSLLANLIVQDLKAGRGCLVVDGKGDLAEDVLARVPESRQGDVIVLDPSREMAVPGLRLFGRGGDPELTADLVLGVLRDLFADHWGVRSDQWLRAGLVTLAHDPKATLADLPFLFSDDSYRQGLVGGLTDPLLLTTWAAFEAMTPQERAHQLGAPLNKLSELVGRKVVRGVLAQPTPKWDMRQALARRQVVIVSLSPGQIGAPSARLLGALVMHELFKAVQARAAIAPGKRRPFFAYIDEPAVFKHVPVPLDSLFEMARGMGVGLMLGVQSISQLPPGVARAALTNAASLVVFAQAADDAALLARELPGVNDDELAQLGRFEVVAKLGLGPGEVAAPATGHTMPLPPLGSDAAAVRRHSAERYGADADEVDAALRRRHGLEAIAAPATASPEMREVPLGRRRRRS